MQSYFLLCTLLCGVTPIYAEELQITDYLGLIRAQSQIYGKATVSITVRVEDDADLLDKTVPVLTQRTGIALDIESVQKSRLEYRFENVSAGVWRIRLRNKGLVLDSVTIEEK